jgi:hypothetical protein
MLAIMSTIMNATSWFVHEGMYASTEGYFHGLVWYLWYRHDLWTHIYMNVPMVVSIGRLLGKIRNFHTLGADTRKEAKHQKDTKGGVLSGKLHSVSHNTPSNLVQGMIPWPQPIAIPAQCRPHSRGRYAEGGNIGETNLLVAYNAVNMLWFNAITNYWQTLFNTTTSTMHAQLTRILPAQTLSSNQ